MHELEAEIASSDYQCTHVTHESEGAHVTLTGCIRALKSGKRIGLYSSSNVSINCAFMPHLYAIRGCFQNRLS